jgi:hypothetical protein
MRRHGLEGFLALIYVDSNARSRFRANPLEEARRAGLTENECAELAATDWAGLELMCRGFARKRHLKGKGFTGSWLVRLWRKL